MAKTTESVTQDIMNVEFTDTSKAKMFDDSGYEEDKDNSREVAEVVPISKDLSPLEKTVHPKGRREQFKNSDKPNPFKKG
jgi:hypothetical protein